MERIISTPVKFRVKGGNLCLNVSVRENKDVADIRNVLEDYPNFFCALDWVDGRKKEPIRLSKEVLDMYNIENLNSGLQIGSKYMKGSCCEHDGNLRICTKYRDEFLSLDYLHELEIVYKLLKGEELINLSGIS